ncbi:DUF411 domain-containing protein [Oscillatoria salina]|uniref:DUF411 domain-containing protein n=1 Tax=Oscillatoria salina TaxID=331517 RepID=UPI0013B7524A|nr:DUF411 domain-containing protein [Oscillatoria salina]MBZ8179023.1 DUF411 domain-containing protein [Oscillatoria salina IIICB1]NET88476.1 DUF411 domain-containing protein [Kamptonema sp. SIO1D9]
MNNFLKWSVFFVSVTAVGLAAIIYFPFQKKNDLASSNLPTLENNPNSVVAVSVWDRNIKPYTGNSELTVYRSPSCGCCGEWVKHMQKHGFQVKDIQTDEMETLKQQYNLPEELASCHTAIVDGYVVEGHIPGNDVKRLLQQKPDIAGIAVPGMPLGSPGMEAGDRKEAFAVISFNQSGETEIFAEHLSY